MSEAQFQNQFPVATPAPSEANDAALRLAQLAPACLPPVGTGVALVAPSGYAPDEGRVARGIALLEAMGCTVHNYYDPAAKHQRFGGTDAARVEQLMAAARNPAVRVVMAIRGSYGLSRILPLLDWPALAASGKLFVGYSDFTAFNMALLAQTGAISFAGPMLCADFSGAEPSPFTVNGFWRCMGGEAYGIAGISGISGVSGVSGNAGGNAEDNAGEDAAGNPDLDVSGTLWGGNLAMLGHLVGTPYMPQVEGGILFVEDINEHPYRVERLLLQLLHAGVLGRQRALLLGNFSDYKLGAYDNGYDFGAMLSFLRARLPIPVLTGLPFGHCRDLATLPVGAQARLVSAAGAWRLELGAYPTL